MESRVIEYDDELEDGEISDSDVDYTPLQRPSSNPSGNLQTVNHQLQQQHKNASQQITKMDDAIENDSVSDFGVSSYSSDDSDEIINAAKINDNRMQKKKKIKKRTVLLRNKPLDSLLVEPQNDKISATKSKFKKYDIWAASVQESLTDNMREIGVGGCNMNYDRDVESYDFTLKYEFDDKRKRLGPFKRRYSATKCSDDEESDNLDGNSKDGFNKKHYPRNKRSKYSSYDIKKKDLNKRHESSSSCDSQNEPRYIPDVNFNADNDELAKDIARKLHEEKDELMCRVVQVLGKQIPIEIFKETQRIEKDGGMMIMNGFRRRTSGGVFFFLLKHHDKISPENKKLIFHDDSTAQNHRRKTLKSIKRDKKVEELKKQLNMKEQQLLSLSKRNDDDSQKMCHLKPDTHANLSNPPPSPVTNAGLESSPDYTTHAINHVVDASPEKLTTNNDEDNLYSIDDVLDMNYSDMEYF